MAHAVMALYSAKHNSVNDCYKNPSTTKQFIEHHIQCEMDSNNGFNYRVLSFNVFFFTCGYLYETIDTETGEILIKMVIHKPSRTDIYDVTRFIEYNDKQVYGIKIGYEYQPSKYCKELLTLQAN